jgi:hypothetical protein
MYERRHEPLAPRSAFLRRLALNAGFALLIFVGSLAVGIAGYHYLVGLGWLDSLLNASMILGGMGPVDPVRGESGKIFASLYALYSGLIVLAVAGLIFAPIFHRFLHHFHIEIDDTDEGQVDSREPAE